MHKRGYKENILELKHKLDDGYVNMITAISWTKSVKMFIMGIK